MNEAIVAGGAPFINCIRSLVTGTRVRFHEYSSGVVCRDALHTLSPGLVIIGPGLDDVTPVNLAAALRFDEEQAGQEGLRIILVEPQVTGSVTGRARAAGANDVLSLRDVSKLKAELTPAPPSLRSAFVEASVSDVVSSRASSPQTSGEGDGSIVCVSGGRGGVGKSTLSILTALSLAKRGYHVALVDFDLQFGDLAYLFGREEATPLDRLAERAEVEGALARQLPTLATSVAFEVDLFSCPSVPEASDGIAARVPAVLAAFRQVYDISVFNTSTSWGDAQAELVSSSDACFIVVDQRISALDAARRELALLGRMGIPTVRTPCILNRFNLKAALGVMDAQTALDGVPIHTVRDGLGEVAELIGVGCPEELFTLKSPCVTDIANVIDETLVPLGLISQSGKREKRGLFSWRRSA